MANSAMVCSSPVKVVSETTPTETAISPDESQQQKSPTDTSVKSSCVANIKNSLSHQGISSQATTLILSSWRKTTEVPVVGKDGNNGVPHLDITVSKRL